MSPEEFQQLLRGGARGGVQKGLLVAMTTIALKLEAKAKKNATRSPRARTGALRNSIAGSVRPERTGVSVYLRAGGSKLGRAPVPYARIQELGDTIRMKNKFLSIPTDEVKTAGGDPRFSSPLQDVGLFFSPRSYGGVLRSSETGKVHWVLKREVTIKPKKYLWRAIRDVQRDVPKHLRDVMAIALQAKLVRSTKAGP